MSWAKRLARVFLGGRSREKGANGPRGRRVAVEALEDRRLLSVGGSDLFGPPQGLVPTAQGCYSLVAADINEDGHTDLVAAASMEDKVTWFENDGTGRFTEHVVNPFGGDIAIVADINGDGHIDVVSGDHYAETIAWHENDGSGNFQEHIVGTSERPSSLAVADVDSDGSLDILSASAYNNSITWYRNQGEESFAAHAIDSSFYMARSVFAADIDGDGDADVGAASDNGHGYGTIAWYENTGSGQFTERVIAEVAGTTVVAADMNGDGHMDVLSTYYSGSRHKRGQITWWENDGNQGFVSHSISDWACRAALAVDINADGRLDVISASAKYGTALWYENIGNGSFAEHTISTASVGTPSAGREWAWAGAVADFNGDGNLDVASAAYNSIAWYENDGNENFTDHAILVTPDRVHSVVAADLNGDGRTDAVSASFDDDRIAWYENQGKGNFHAHTITTAADGAGSVATADLNDDGALDVVSSSRLDNTIAWYENNGSGQFTERVITGSADGATHVSVSDIDSDGDIDVLSASYDDDTIAWYENDGRANFALHVISKSVDGAVFVSASDFNADGRMDVISRSGIDGEVAWFENLGNAQFAKHVLGPLGRIEVLDINRDGYSDIIALNSQTVAWYENTGAGVFVERVITNSGYGPGTILAADIDSDGDHDVLSASWQSGEIGLYENIGSDHFVTHVLTSKTVHPTSLALIDVDEDTDLDLLWGTEYAPFLAWQENKPADGEDFGDAPESYGTTLVSGGARHKATGPTLGATRDSEEDGLPAVAADGDDKEGTDDESGVTFPSTLRVGMNDATATVSVQQAPMGARLDAWIDFDGNGTFDAQEEHIADSLSLSEGDNSIQFAVPSNAALGATYARFRLSRAGNVAATGLATDGEVEDYRVVIYSGDLRFDYGDAPDNYGTTLAADGASHAAFGPTLGNARDTEGDGRPSIGADGDDGSNNDDEDGVRFESAIRVGQLDAAVIVTVQNAPDGAKLDAWIDFDRDGAFGNAGEQIASSRHVENGDNVILFDVPGWAISDATTARFRLSTTGDLGSRGTATDGEVEDYEVSISAVPASGSFGGQQILTSTANGVQSVSAADINGDGHMDVLSASFQDDRIVWYENDGSANFTAHTISRTVDGAFQAIGVDLDGDGLMDVVTASTQSSHVNGEIRWYRNRGNGVFAERVLAIASYLTGAVVADINSDGHMDVLYGSTSTLRWLENHGNECFTDQIIGLSSSRVGAAMPAAVTDINRDGSMDIVCAHRWVQSDVPETHRSVVWYENDGHEGFTRHTVTSSSETTYSDIDVGDFNGDGHVDLLVASDDTPHLAWYENDGDGGFARHAIETVSYWGGPLYVADINGDGYLDFLSAPSADTLSVPGAPIGENEVVWHMNDGSGVFSAHTIATSPTRFTSVFSADVDGDGDTDVLWANASDDTIAWYEQLGSPTAEIGEIDFRHLPAIGAGAERYSFTTTRAGYLTVDATFASAAGDVTIRLLDDSGLLLNEVASTAGYVRIDHIAQAAGTAYQVQVTGTNTNVDVRICNLVSHTGESVNVFDTEGNDAFLFSVSDTFNVTANGVDYRFDDATSFTFHSEAGDDTIEMVDSDGDDTLTVSPSQMVLSGTTSGGTAFSATADGFRYAHGYAKAGGNDAAQFVGSAQADRVKAYEQLVKAMGGAHYARAKFFERVEVDLGDGVDAAVIVPSSGSDVLRAMKDEVCVAHDVDLAAGARPAFASMAYDVTIVGAERVVARGRGGDDWVELHDSALNDVFIAKPHKVEMMNGPREGVERGAEYRISARGYRNVSAIADQGGDTDVAKLYDTGEEGVDVWAAAYADGQTWSTMASPSRLLYEVLAFEQVGGYGFNGGLGEGHGTNRPEHGDDVDFVFKYGYWEGDEEPGPTDPRTERGR